MIKSLDILVFEASFRAAILPGFEISAKRPAKQEFQEIPSVHRKRASSCEPRYGCVSIR